ncbi:AraC family transcriptional regulator [[Clostridium] hylemonae]|uniref:AraC family transcriptional regulator n=1 Tax=[Clostridium] hylemonae TaxID=89153 RepID=UPI001FCBFCBB|nr:AraC family transcriptional regulator [[Clostridium] hylemonae]BDF04201.1 putative HTH-type transcriptional regulator YdeC [[Clostridium] hylemonae]
MIREIITDKNMLELNPHGNYGFPFYLIYVTLSAYQFGRFNCHWHPELEIACILEGTMTYQVNQNLYQLGKGDCLFVNSNALHSGCMYENNDCKYIVATFNPSLIYGYEKSDIDTNYTFPLLNTDNFTSFVFRDGADGNETFQKIMKEMAAFYTEENACYELHIKSRLCELWALLFEEFQRSQLPSGAGLAEAKQISRLKNAIIFIHSSYTDPITLDQMAESCHTSKSEFCRIFKKTLHQTPFEYLLRYRIQKSLPLLVTDTCSITEIASQVGFSGSSYYSEVFRKYMGCSPREYKKNLMN